jgi:hypothetical protein
LSVSSVTCPSAGILEPKLCHLSQVCAIHPSSGHHSGPSLAICHPFLWTIVRLIYSWAVQPSPIILCEPLPAFLGPLPDAPIILCGPMPQSGPLLPQSSSVAVAPIGLVPTFRGLFPQYGILRPNSSPGQCPNWLFPQPYSVGQSPNYFCGLSVKVLAETLDRTTSAKVGRCFAKSMVSVSVVRWFRRGFAAKRC